MSKVTLLAFAALLPSLGLSGCGGGGVEETANIASSITSDTIPPSAPAGLTATAVSSSQINLSWNAAKDNVGVTGYNVYRDGAQIATLEAVTTFQNTGLTPFTDYSYTVENVNGKVKSSGKSSEARAKTKPAPDTTAPSTPTGLTASAASSSQINLSWTAATDNVGVTGYNVYRGGMLIATLGAITAFQDAGLAVFTAYSYSVQAFDAVGNVSGRSLTANATTLASSGAITLTLMPGRTSGVAPLAAVFDATGTTSAATTRPVHDVEYGCDFGDPGSGNRAPTNNNKNVFCNGFRSEK